jgi:hypothetical protein
MFFKFLEKLKEKDKLIEKLQFQLDNIGLKQNPQKDVASIKIYVKMESGKSIPLDVLKTDTILKIKRNIEELERIPINQFGLVHLGRELANDRTVGEYNILESATLYSFSSLNW